jgi:lipid-binding SYLF domain-containing protein
MMNRRIRNASWLLLVASIVAGSFVLSAAFPMRAQGDEKKKKKQAKVLEMKDKALADLIKGKPEVASEIKNAPGYAVFDNNGIHLLLLATSRGNGVVISNGSAPPFFMKMRQIGAGPGIGVKDYRVIFVFKTVAAMSKFKSGGWDSTAEADAAAKTKDSGGAASATGSSVSDTRVYTITKKGIALQATFGGTKFRKDDDLN